MLTLSGFSFDREEQLNALFSQLTFDWCGGWCRDVSITNTNAGIFIHIAGWDLGSHRVDNIDDLIAWMHDYWR